MVKALQAHDNALRAIRLDCLDDLNKALKAAGIWTRTPSIAKSQQACQKQQDACDSKSGHGAKEGVEFDEDA
jgi:hypothetical protein